MGAGSTVSRLEHVEARPPGLKGHDEGGQGGHQIFLIIWLMTYTVFIYIYHNMINNLYM